MVCYRDGWGPNVNLAFISADVTIRAWQFTSSDVVFTSEFSFIKGDTLPGTIPFGTTINLDHHLVVVEVSDFDSFQVCIAPPALQLLIRPLSSYK